ncbi:hypothetical protein ACI1US_00400 [Leucobacter sp. BZR 635]
MKGTGIAHTLNGVREHTHLDVLFGGYTAPDTDRFTITHAVGVRTAELKGLVIRSGAGLGGLALAQATPAFANDYLHDPSISRDYDRAVAAEELRAVAALPIVIEGEARGIVYGAHRHAGPLSEPEVESIAEAADTIAFRLAVDDAVTKQTTAVETAEYLRSVRSAPSDREWEQVRAAFAELREFARTVEDPTAQAELHGILTKLAPGGTEEGPALSAREVDVLALVAIGLTNREIGERLFLELETVKSYLRAAMRKLGAHNRVESVALARRYGQLP